MYPDHQSIIDDCNPGHADGCQPPNY